MIYTLVQLKPIKHEVRTVVNACFGDCIWNLNYNPIRQCIELEMERHLNDEELVLLSSQFTLPANYDGVRMDVQVLCEQVLFIDNYPLSAFGNH